MPAETLTKEDVLRAAMAACGESQAELAEATNQSESTVSRWLSGKTVPQEGSVLRLAKLTKTPPADALRAFGYDPVALGIGTKMSRTRPPTPTYDLRLLRVSQMLEQFALEVKAMATASQLSNGSILQGDASSNRVEYVYQTSPLRRQTPPFLTLVQVDSPDIPQAGDSYAEAIA